MKRLSFFFDYSSPFAYLGATQIERVAQAHGAELRWRPFLLGGLFKSIGTANVPLLAMPAAKQQHEHRDMLRWAEHWQVPFAFPTRFPMRTVTALRMTLQVGNERRGELARCLFHAYWALDRDLADPRVLAALADDAGFDGAGLVDGACAADVKSSLRQETEAAERLGICGAPSFLIESGQGDEGVLFWGQDRLLFVERALEGWKPRTG